MVASGKNKGKKKSNQKKNWSREGEVSVFRQCWLGSRDRSDRNV